jgi:hypothetical protein
LVPEYSSNIIQTTNIYIYIANQFNIQNQVKQPEYSKLYIQNVHAKQPEYSSKTTSPKILLAAKISANKSSYIASQNPTKFQKTCSYSSMQCKINDHTTQKNMLPKVLANRTTHLLIILLGH